MNLEQINSKRHEHTIAYHQKLINPFQITHSLAHIPRILKSSFCYHESYQKSSAKSLTEIIHPLFYGDFP